MEGINFIKRPRLKNPSLIVAWPGMGEVAFKAASYLVEELGCQEFASIPSEDFFYLTGSIVKTGVLELLEFPSGKFYFRKSPDLIIFISNAQPDLVKADIYSKRIVNLAHSFKVKRIIGFAAMPAPIDHTQEPKVWFSGTSKEANDELKKYHLNLLSDGQISGMNGLFLGIAKKEGFEGFCLLGEVPLYTINIENPKAALSVLNALSKILNFKLSFSKLIEQIRTMEAEINKLFDYLKLDTQGQAGPIGEEEIEKIKKSLSQLTKLPISVKDKIEQLFNQAKVDVSKAYELKAELDKWNAYKEYEDRFLDLFKKTKERENS